MFGNIFSQKENDLTGQEFKNKFQQTENAVLLDVRTPGEFAGGTIQGSENIDFMAPDFQTRIGKLDPQNTYFLFCRSGNRSGAAASLMSKMGFKTYNLIGGITSWPV